VTYHTCCVASTAESINAMTDAAVEITYRTFRKYAEGLGEWSVEMGYVLRSNQDHGLTLRNDWHVSYHKSVYQGKPCVYLRHSAIEYIWI